MSESIKLFIVNARCHDGSNYKATSLKTGITSLNRVLMKKYGVLFIARGKPAFKTLDAQMKTMQGQGLGFTEHHPVIISEQEVKLLEVWDPSNLFDLMCLVWYYISKFCALRGGEAREVVVDQLVKCHTDDGREYFTYQFALEKNQQGGL